MQHSSYAITALVAALLAATASGAAETGAPAITAVSENAQLGGPVVSGTCLLSREAVLENAKVGKAATARLQQLAAQAQEQINNDRKPLDVELEELQKRGNKLDAQERRKREQDISARLDPLRVRAEQLSREIEATRLKAVERISLEAQPVIAKVYKDKGCGLLFDRNLVLGGNFSNDLTAAVVAGLDQRITTLTFEREVLPPQSAAR
ncbi:MAG TPA: OmpH family outer membrane protein [Steroidobacter sp.]|nr:OmpH family outer membrane protein [Steroidobacter sp.]